VDCEFCGHPVVSVEKIHGQTICEKCLDQQVQEVMERAFNRYLTKRTSPTKP
jgi:reverse gyrase